MSSLTYSRRRTECFLWLKCSRRQLMKIEAICSRGTYIPGRRNGADPEKATWCRQRQGINAKQAARLDRRRRMLFLTLSRDLKTVRGVSRENHTPGRASSQRPVNGHLCALDGWQRLVAEQSWWGLWAAEALREHVGTPASHRNLIRNHTAEEWHDLNPVSEQSVWLLSKQTAEGPWVNKPGNKFWDGCKSPGRIVAWTRVQVADTVKGEWTQDSGFCQQSQEAPRRAEWRRADKNRHRQQAWDRPASRVRRQVNRTQQGREIFPKCESGPLHPHSLYQPYSL